MVTRGRLSEMLGTLAIIWILFKGRELVLFLGGSRRLLMKLPLVRSHGF